MNSQTNSSPAEIAASLSKTDRAVLLGKYAPKTIPAGCSAPFRRMVAAGLMTRTYFGKPTRTTLGHEVAALLP